MSDEDEYERSWREDPTAKRFVKHVISDMKPKMEASALVAQLVPEDDEGDVKFWVELGASIMMNKPIIAIIVGDREVPPKLALIADEVVRCPDGMNEEAADLIEAAAARVLAGEFRTETGKVLTDEDFERLADEAQEGHPDA